MKRLLLILVVLLFLLPVCGCKKSAETISNPANFYYRSSSTEFFTDDSVIKPEIRETQQCGENILNIINLYFQGPISDDYTTPFPQELVALEVEQNNESLLIKLNDSFANLNGVDRTLACSCILKTVADLTNCSTVELQFPSPNSDQSNSIQLSVDDLCFIDLDSSN